MFRRLLPSCHRLAVAFGGLCLAGAAAATPADPALPAPSGDHWVLTLSPYTYHWHYDPAHVHVFLAGLEHRDADNTFKGVSLFRNSFGQPAAYAYYGWQWDQVLNQPALYAKLSLGVIYGYLPPYNDKVPLNYHGYSPGVIPALGYRLDPQDAIQLNLLGTAGLMLSYTREF
ncbi:MAG: ABC transporter ATP-binding protein [Curvibacter sp.]|nr:ABC transporter ATP-binding protein [Curvibacter sp.]